MNICREVISFPGKLPACPAVRMAFNHKHYDDHQILSKIALEEDSVKESIVQPPMCLQYGD